MKQEDKDIPDVLDVTRFARQHPALDQALREQIRAPVMDGAFRRQVMARVAAQRAEMTRAAVAPEALRARLRTRLLLQLANHCGAVVAAVLVVRAAWPWLGALLAESHRILPASAWMKQSWDLPLALMLAGAALLYGLQRARLLGWVRGLDL